MKTLSGKIRNLALGLLGTSAIFMICLAAYVGFSSQSDIENAYEKSNRSAAEKRRDQVRWTGQGVLAPLASQIGARRLDLIARAQRLGASSHIKKAVSPAQPRAARQAALATAVGSNAGAIYALKAITSYGSVIAAWKKGKADPLALGKSRSSDPIFSRLKKDRNLWGQAIVTGYRRAQTSGINKKRSKPSRPKKPTKNKKNTAHSKKSQHGLMIVAVPLKNSKGGFGGILEIAYKMESLFGLAPKAALAPLKRVSENAVLMLLQGTGLEYYSSGGKAFVEDFSKVSSAYKKVLGLMTAAEKGGEELRYDTTIAGKKERPRGMLVWQRVGYWDAEIAGPEQLHVLAAFMPFSDFKSASRFKEKTGNIFTDPVFWLLFLLMSSMLLGGGFVLIKNQFAPLAETAEAVSRLDEFGGSDELFEFPEQKLKDLNAITSALNLLLQRAATAENRVKELDESLRRQEEQASRETTEQTAEMQSLREKINGINSEKETALADVKSANTEIGSLQTKTGNLQAAVDTAQKALELKNTQNKSLGDQVTEMMAALEEQRKIAEEATENSVQRGNEEVRLEAIKTLSSELKATLGVIKNYISTMLGSVGKISDAQQEFLGVVINKSARLERLINDLVDLSQIGTGLASPKFENVDLSSLIREVILNVQVQADHKKISLDFAEGGGVIEARVDKARLAQVIRILLTQAIKVTARSEKISVLASEREGQIEIRISDPGMSLPPDRAQKVFSLFHGVDSLAGPEFIGTGLRFPIVQSVMNSHGGGVKIESQVGRGKTFVLTLSKKEQINKGGRVVKPAIPQVPVLPSNKLVTPVSKSVVPKTTLGSPASSSSASPKDIEKPKNLPGQLGTPWKKEKISEQMSNAEELAKNSSPKELPSFGGASPAKEKISELNSGETANFDKIFGKGAPAPPPPPGAVPAKKPASSTVSKTETANFDKIFGKGAPAPPPPSGVASVPAPAEKPAAPAVSKTETANFDKIFGEGAAPPPPPVKTASPLELKPAAKSAPPPSQVPSAPPPPVNAGDKANFDKIFGKGAPAPPPPSPTPKAAAPSPPKESSGGLNTLDDLNNMIGGS